jgi:hypothetical protein
LFDATVTEAAAGGIFDSTKLTAADREALNMFAPVNAEFIGVGC